MFQFNLILIDSTILVRRSLNENRRKYLIYNYSLRSAFSLALSLHVEKRERYQKISIPNPREEAKFQASTHRLSARRLGFIEYLGILSQNGRSSSS